MDQFPQFEEKNAMTIYFYFLIIKNISNCLNDIIRPQMMQKKQDT